MKIKLLALLLIMFTILGQQCAFCSQIKTTNKTYTTRNSQGVSTNKVRVYSSGSQVVRIDYYNSQGVRKGYTKIK